MGSYGIFRNGTEEEVASRFSSHPSKNLPFQLAFLHSHHSRVIVTYLLNKVSKSTKLIVTNPMYRKTLLPFLEKYFYMRGLQIGYEVVIIIVGQVHYKTFFEDICLIITSSYKYFSLIKAVKIKWLVKRVSRAYFSVLALLSSKIYFQSKK